MLAVSYFCIVSTLLVVLVTHCIALIGNVENLYHELLKGMEKRLRDQYAEYMTRYDFLMIDKKSRIDQ